MFDSSDRAAIRKLWGEFQAGEVIVHGNLPWNSTGWEFSESFVKKYPLLLDEDTLQTTNFWRSQRGDAILDAPPMISVS
jgi:hypothetical protein